MPINDEFQEMIDRINGDQAVRSEVAATVPPPQNPGKPLPEVLGEPAPIAPKKVSNPAMAVLQPEAEAEVIAAKARMAAPKPLPTPKPVATPKPAVVATTTDSLTAGLPKYCDFATEMARVQAKVAPLAVAAEQTQKPGIFKRIWQGMNAPLEKQGGIVSWFGRRGEGAMQTGWTVTRGVAYDIPKAGIAGIVEHGGNALSKTGSMLKSGAGHIHRGASNVMLAGAAGVAVLGLGAALSAPTRAVASMPKFNDGPASSDALAFAGGNATVDVGGVAMPQLGMSQGQSSWMSRIPTQGSVEELLLMNNGLPPSR